MNKKFLIIKPSSLGDIIHGLVVAQSIREQVPDCVIHWVVGSQFAGVVQGCPTVDRILLFHRQGGVIGFLRLIREIRRERYDCALDFQGLARSGLMTLASRARRRLGRADAREGARFAYETLVPQPAAGDSAHAIEVLLEFLPALGLERRLGSPIRLPAEPLSEPFQQLPALRPAVIFPDSREPVKEWPGFADLTHLILERHPACPVVWNSHKEYPSPPRLTSHPRFHNLTQRTSLGQMVRLIQSARVVVANDSGPAHIAAAVGSPVAACFGPTDPNRYGPYPIHHPAHRVVRAPAGDLSKLGVSEVYAAIADLLCGSNA